MRTVIASLVCLLGLPLLAQAQEAVPEMPVPLVSETDAAKPEWFQRFTFSSEDIESPVWQTQPSKDFSLTWREGDRWSLSVDLTSREGVTPLPREEMRAGADFRITPRISIGGELRIGADELDDTTRWQEQDIEAGIRLRSAFVF